MAAKLGALLPWSAVQTAIAAEVGEPEGVRTVVFDLMVERRRRASDPAPRRRARRGRHAARARDRAGGVEGTQAAGIESLAADGTPARWYPDLETFAEARDQVSSRAAEPHRGQKPRFDTMRAMDIGKARRRRTRSTATTVA